MNMPKGNNAGGWWENLPPRMKVATYVFAGVVVVGTIWALVR